MGLRVAGHRACHSHRAGRAVLAALCVGALSCAGAVPAAADGGDEGVGLNTGQCTFPADRIEGTPWALQRLLFDEMWADTEGQGVRVAVVDTGVDDRNPQLSSAVADGKDFIGSGDGTDDRVGHGTKVAGIIAARPATGVGFTGIAPKATIIPIRQNDNRESGVVATLVQGIDYAIEQQADIINVSQGTTASLQPGSVLEQAVNRALAQDILVVASVGNGGASGEEKATYPASLDGVLGVAASDRNNERAPFSQPGDFVDVAAPGVDVVSTVPVGGHCVDHGTSFAAPYAAGVAALVRAKHPDWTHQEVTWHLERTAERVRPGRDDNIGWGVIDPVAAMTENTKPTGAPRRDTDGAAAVQAGEHVIPAKLTLDETPQERRERYGVYVLGIGLLTVALIAGSATAVRDWKRKQLPTGSADR